MSIILNRNRQFCYLNFGGIHIGNDLALVDQRARATYIEQLAGSHDTLLAHRPGILIYDVTYFA